MATNIIMPQGGQDLETGTVVRWLVPEGASVTKGQVVCEIETEKAVFEVNAPAAGVLAKILVPEGQEAKVFAPIGLITAPNEVLPSAAPAAPAQAATAAAAVASPASAAPGSAPASRVGRKIYITPKATKIAKEMGVAYEHLAGSGPQGRIVAADILTEAERIARLAPVPQAAPAPQIERRPAPQAPVYQPAPMPTPIAVSQAVPQVDVSTSAPGQVKALNKIRKVIAQRMQASKQFIPHFYVTVAVDLTETLRFRARYNRRPGLAKEDQASLNDLIIRACVLALKEFPELNSSVLDDDHLILWDDLNLGIAVALDEGLVVPVLEHADWLSLAQLPRQTRRLFNLAKEGKQASLAQSHFTISNLGMYQVESFTAIINPPEAAILAVASVEKRVMPPSGDQLGLRLRDIVNLTLSLDHRIGDGVLAARFLNRLRELLEDPECLA